MTFEIITKNAGGFAPPAFLFKLADIVIVCTQRQGRQAVTMGLRVSEPHNVRAQHDRPS